MPGPPRKFFQRVKFSLSEAQATAIRQEADNRDISDAELIRWCIDRQLKVKAQRVRAVKKKSSKWNGAITRVWDQHTQAREAYWAQKGSSVPQIALTPKRRSTILGALEEYGEEMVSDAGRGIFLSDFHTERGNTGPEYAFRLTNVDRFFQLVQEIRSRNRPK